MEAASAAAGFGLAKVVLRQFKGAKLALPAAEGLFLVSPCSTGGSAARRGSLLLAWQMSLQERLNV